MPTVPRRLAAALALLSLAAVACSDSGSPSATPTTPGVTPSIGTLSPEPIDPSGEPVIGSTGLGIVTFGDDMAPALAALVAAFGEADEDSDWVSAFSPWGTCPGERVRMVRWGRLRVLFADGDTDAGAAGDPHFFTYQYSALEGHPAMDLATAEGIGLGSTVADIKATYGARAEVFDDGPPVGPAFTIAGIGETIVFGSLTGTGDDDVVHFMEAGAPTCGE